MTVKVGMIGAGAIAGDHCRNVNGHGEAEVVAVADLSKARREDVKKTYGLQKAYAKWEDLVADPGIDAVTVALPNSLHAPVALAALNAGKHVLMDKPFTVTVQEAKQVAAAAKRKRRVLMVGMNQRYRPEVQALRALIERGELGDVYHTKTYWHRRTGSPKFGTWFVNKALSGGGCLLDIGVHYLDAALYLIDRWDPVSVTGEVYSKFGPRGLGEGGWGKSDRKKSINFDVDDFATALVRFRDGSSLDLSISWVLHQEKPNDNNVRIFGTEGGASLDPLKLFRFGKKRGEYEVVEPQNVKIEHSYKNRQANWIDAILKQDKPLCTVEQSLVVQKILNAIYTSSEKGKEVRITS